MLPLVSNLEHKNQFTIYTDSYIYFQSYTSVVARVSYYDTPEITLYTYWDYSNTTLRHLYKFLEQECYNFYRNYIAIASNRKQKIQYLINKGIIKYEEVK